MGTEPHSTSAETFSDGSALELISSATMSDPLRLLLQSKQKIKIAKEIVHQGRTYRPSPLSSEIANRLLLPEGVKDYGSAGQLFNQLSKVFIELSALPELQAALVAIWVISSWFADQIFSPPTLCICGPERVRAMRLIEILGCLCRRPLMLTALSPARLASLPMALHPTLLMSSPTPSVLETLLESNFRGVLVLGPDGVAQDLRCAKAVYTGKDLPQSWTNQVIRLPLSPLDEPGRRVGARDLAELQTMFQPRLLKYRLDHWQAVLDSDFVATGLRPETRELANALGACIQMDDEALRQLPALLAAQDNDGLAAHSLDAAILEILWPRLHEKSTGKSKTELKMKAQVTAEVNTYLLAAGETQEFAAEMVGKRTILLGLDHRRTERGSQLLLNSQTSRRIHQLARDLDPGKRVSGCQECEQILAIVKP